ncbi:MAG TPA: aldehyde ferredoxin oxidoreductase N-terminal domain-containing protein [Spirochaetota bacterium]|nr:aldehyde ferredoxin oxidoreductase N-terminal domain-containing protein [Spirochaetota bacterium]
MNTYLKALIVNVADGFYKVNRYKVGDYFGPVDLGLHLSRHFDSLNIGTGLLAGSIFPGSNRLIVTGFSPAWSGFYVSTMGGAGLVFNDLGIDMLAIRGKAPTPSVLYLNRIHGEEIQIDIQPLDIMNIWKSGRGGIYSLTDHVYDMFETQYNNDPRILVTGPAAVYTGYAAIASMPIKKGEISRVDTWAGRGGFGSKMYQEHGLVAIIYGGTFIDQDFRDRTVADQWFVDKYNKKLAAKDLEATAKYRFEENFNTGGTFGVNYATLGGRMISFNYRSIYMTEEKRLEIHEKFVRNHYLKQFNEETIATKQQTTCGEPCVAVCKKMRGEFKKDYEPYQTMGPLSGIFDQRAAEMLNHRADMYGFDAISAGGVVAWLMDCMADGLLKPTDLGLTDRLPKFDPDNFDVVKDSMHNAEIGCEILDSIVEGRSPIDLRTGARKLARRLSGKHNKEIMDRFVCVSFARNGWMVPNQYWTPGVLSPMAIMGKYFMHYGEEFMPPRELGRQDAIRFKKELIIDNMGMCRFHRKWAEEMIPEVMESLFGMQEQYLYKISRAAARINSRNASMFWEGERNIDFIHTFLKRKRDVDGEKHPDLEKWLAEFEKDKKEAALSFWYEIHKGIQETLKDF